LPKIIEFRGAQRRQRKLLHLLLIHLEQMALETIGTTSRSPWPLMMMILHQRKISVVPNSTGALQLLVPVLAGKLERQNARRSERNGRAITTERDKRQKQR